VRSPDTVQLTPLPTTKCVLMGWGRTAPTAAYVVRPASIDECSALIEDPPTRGLIVRGAGRSYGDAAQNAGGCAVLLQSIARQVRLDIPNRRVVAGAAVSLAELIELLVPRGYFLPVVPGTAHITVGGAIAADIHGKNHHRDSSIGAHIDSLKVLTASGSIDADKTSDHDVFAAVVGGMGLAGMIIEAGIGIEPIESAWMAVDTKKTSDIEETMAELESLDRKRQYSVAWVDSSARGRALGRGIVQGADHADAASVTECGKTPFYPFVLGSRIRLLEFGSAPQGWPEDAEGIIPPPESSDPVATAASICEELALALRPARPVTIASFNRVWYWRSPKNENDSLLPLAKFFFPLDGMPGWNRLYGKAGFVQYQFVVPDGSEVVIADALSQLVSIGAYSPVTVLKRMGPASNFPMSFPIPGWTLAVDIPAGIEGLGNVLARLDTLIAEAGGRVYLAKDSRMRAEMLSAMYGRLEEWQELRSKLDPQGIFESDLSRRLSLKEKSR
jgi:decaprenylphospho-beta-D-ribofuranose 2-oxidase